MGVAAQNVLLRALFPAGLQYSLQYNLWYNSGYSFAITKNKKQNSGLVMLYCFHFSDVPTHTTAVIPITKCWSILLKVHICVSHIMGWAVHIRKCCTDRHASDKNAVKSHWPSAKRVAPDDDQAVPAACLHPLVHVESISGQTGFSRLPRGITKTCQRVTERWQHLIIITSARRRV